MSHPFAGVPIEPTGSPRAGLPVFDHIPRLRELLPQGGTPGIVYATVCVHNLQRAALRQEKPANLRELRGGAIYFVIEGPDGRAEAALVGTGRAIPGGQPESGNRLHFTDGEIETLTGLEIQYPIWFRATQEERHAGVPRAQATEDREGDGGVEARPAPQRKPERPRGQKP